jgi:hypothetical protein
MATSTLIQLLQPGEAADTSNRSQVETFLTTLTNSTGSTATITLPAGDWVALDTSKTGADRALFVTRAANVALGNPLVVGVAKTTASAVLLNGESRNVKIDVVVAGYAGAANVDGAVVAGSPLAVDTTAGRAHTAVTGDISVCGVALEADVSNVAAVWVYKQF